jgi:Protein of unknown function (DUF3396)
MTANDLFLAAEDGTPIAVPAFGMAFYTDRVFTEIGEPVLHLFDAFLALAPAGELRWYGTENMNRHKPVTKKTADMLRLWLAPDAPPREYVMLEMKSGDAFNAAGDVRCTVFGNEVGSVGLDVGDAGIISFALPFDWGLARKAELFDFFLDACERFPFRFAWAGYSFEWSRYAMSTAHPFIWARSMRHHGIGISWPSLEGKAIKNDSVLGVSWLTAICDDFVERVGGQEQLRKRLHAPVELIECDGGLLMKAGDVPALGDTHRTDLLPAYQQVHAAIEPLIEPMVDRYPSLSLNKDRFENTEAWLRRHRP